MFAHWWRLDIQNGTAVLTDGKKEIRMPFLAGKGVYGRQAREARHKMRVQAPDAKSLAPFLQELLKPVSTGPFAPCVQVQVSGRDDLDQWRMALLSAGARKIRFARRADGLVQDGVVVDANAYGTELSLYENGRPIQSVWLDQGAASLDRELERTIQKQFRCLVHPMDLAELRMACLDRIAKKDGRPVAFCGLNRHGKLEQLELDPAVLKPAFYEYAGNVRALARAMGNGPVVNAGTLFDGKEGDHD